MGDLSRNKKNAQDECIYVDDSEILRVIFSKVSLKSDTLVNSAVSRDW